MRKKVKYKSHSCFTGFTAFYKIYKILYMAAKALSIRACEASGRKKRGPLHLTAAPAGLVLVYRISTLVVSGSSRFTVLGTDSFRMPSSYLAEISSGRIALPT